MENKKTFKVILIGMLIYILLSWIIVSGNFSSGSFNSKGFNQVGIFDILSAPLQLFNYFAVTMTKNIDGFVNQVAYVNIIVAFICIGIFYGVLNKTDVYHILINDIEEKVHKKKGIFLIAVASIYFLFSALTGLNLISFMFFPALSAILSKLKYNKPTIFMSTIGACILGISASILNPTINGLNRVIFGLSINDNLVTRIIYLIMLLIVLIAFLVLKRNKEVDSYESLPLIVDTELKSASKKRKKVISHKSYYPIVITTIIMTVVLFVCMYNWYYIFNSSTITSAYDRVLASNINNYTFMKNIFGMSESFGYWTGFNMSLLLLLASLVISFMYRIKFNDMLDSAKEGIIQMLPTVFYSIISLSVIVISLNNNTSFVYSIINNMFKFNNLVLGIFSASFIHNFFINDYFALLSSLSSPLLNIYGADKIGNTLFTAQVGHGLVSFITPFNVYLIAGLSFLNLSYTQWIKYVWKFLVIVFILSFVVLFITALAV